MAGHDETILDLIDELRATRADIRVLHTKLFGEDDEETPHGRLPMIEAQLKSHGEDIQALKEKQNRRDWTWSMLCLMAGIVVGVSAFMYHVKTILGH